MGGSQVKFEAPALARPLLQSTHLALDEERKNLLELVAALALAFHKFDPRPRRSRQVAKIHQKIEAVGIPIDIDTVRKWLRKASAYLAAAGNISANKPLHPKEKGSLRRLILGMVAAHYGPSWGYADGPVARKIQQDLAQVGKNMDISSIAEAVREAECDVGHLLIAD